MRTFRTCSLFAQERGDWLANSHAFGRAYGRSPEGTTVPPFSGLPIYPRVKRLVANSSTLVTYIDLLASFAGLFCQHFVLYRKPLFGFSWVRLLFFSQWRSSFSHKYNYTLSALYRKQQSNHNSKAICLVILLLALLCPTLFLFVQFL